MPTSIDQLHALQRVDGALRRHQVELDELASAATSARLQVEEKRPVVMARRHEMAELERRRREIEARLADDEEKMKDRRMRMQRIRNEKELGALRREIELMKEQDSALEDELLRIMETGDTRAGELKTLEEDLGQLESALGEHQARHTERIQALREEMDRLRADRAVVTQELDDTLRKRYELLLARKDGLAVVEIHQGHCTGCRVRIPPQLITQVHRSQVVFCPSCQRILCHPPRESEPKTES